MARRTTAYGFKPIKRPAGKYKNTNVEFDGHKFDSKKEADRYRKLKSWQELGVISDLRCHQTFDLVPKQRHPITGEAIRAVVYEADFVYVDNETGKTVVEDVKGYRNPADSAYRIFRIKQKLMLYRFQIWVKEI